MCSASLWGNHSTDALPLIVMSANVFNAASVASSGVECQVSPDKAPSSRLPDLARRRIRLFGSLFDERGDRIWLRYVDRVTAHDLDDCRTRALGHEVLGRRWDHLVVGGDQVPTRLGPPRRLADRTAECAHAPRDLGVGHERCPFCVYVSRECGGELRPVEEEIAVLRRQYRWYWRARWWLLDKRGHRLASVRGKGGDIDKPCDLWIVA